MTDEELKDMLNNFVRRDFRDAVDDLLALRAAVRREHALVMEIRHKGDAGPKLRKDCKDYEAARAEVDRLVAGEKGE